MIETALKQVRLASAGSMLTAVALELVAGKTWAAGLTRKPGAGLDRYSTPRGFQLEEPPAAFGRRGRLGCPRPRKSHTDSTDGMLVTRGRGCRPRVGPPLGHTGPVCRQTEQDEEEHVAAVSGRGPRTALHGVTGTARLRRVEGSLRKPGRPGGWTLGHHPGRSPCALVVIGRGPTPVKILFRLRLQKFVPGVVPQPLVRVEGMLSTPQYISKGRG